MVVVTLLNRSQADVEFQGEQSQQDDQRYADRKVGGRWQRQ